MTEELPKADALRQSCHTCEQVIGDKEERTTVGPVVFHRTLSECVRALQGRLYVTQTHAQRLKDREPYFASVLGVSDGGQYRADWDSSIRRVLEERADALKKVDSAYNQGLRDGMEKAASIASGIVGSCEDVGAHVDYALAQIPKAIREDIPKDDPIPSDRAYFDTAGVRFEETTDKDGTFLRASAFGFQGPWMRSHLAAFQGFLTQHFVPIFKHLRWRKR